MALWQNIPFFLILFPLLCAGTLSILPAKAAKITLTLELTLVTAASVWLLAELVGAPTPMSYTIAMGEFGAPFGNELRIGVLEAAIAALFAAVMLLSILGGAHWMAIDIGERRVGLLAAVLSLLTAALMALTMTNDLFTGYVFIEIATIGACALIAVRERGRALFGAARYMLMSLIGSGLFLLGMCILYCLTGQLLFPQLHASIATMMADGAYRAPLVLSLLMMTIGLCLKSALYPFHTWLPNAYAIATPTASAVLASLVSKGYIVLLLKMIYRVASVAIFAQTGIGDVLFAFSLLGMIMGSIDAIREPGLRRMISYSSVSQIGYIYLGLSMGTEAGAAAAVFYLGAHSLAKAALFLSARRLIDVSDGKYGFRKLRGAGYRAPLAGIAFAVAAGSIVGLPLLAGFAGKLYLAEAARALTPWRTYLVLGALALSTLLNVMYFLRTVMTLYRTEDVRAPRVSSGDFSTPRWAFGVAMVGLIGLMVAAGLWGSTVLSWIQTGIHQYL